MILRRCCAYLVSAVFLVMCTVCLPSASAQGETVSAHTIGIYRPAINNFYLSNTTTGEADFIVSLAKLGMQYTDLPMAGDWNGDGIDTLGFYSTTTATFVLSDSNIAPKADYTFPLGQLGDTPIAGDWDGDGRDGVGLFRPGSGIIYLKNEVNAGFADFEAAMGNAGDVALAGDWNRDGVDSPGVYRPSDGVFYLTDTICSCTAPVDYTTTLGTADDHPFSGDWDGDGRDGIGIYNAADGTITLRNDLTTTGLADDAVLHGITSGLPLAGRWGRLVSNQATFTRTPTK